MQDLGLIVTLAAGFAIALLFGLVTQKLGLSPILGYLIAGIVVGPFTPGLVVDGHVAEQLAEVGVILLMFGVGLHFHLKDLLAVRKIAIPGAIVQSAVATALGALLAHALGWDWGTGIILGIAVAVASTVVLIRVLTDNNVLDSSQGHIAVGWLIVEDIFTVLVLVLLPVIASSVEQGSGDVLAILASLGLALLKIGALGLLVLFGGGKFIPWFLTIVARTRSRELFTLAVLAFALVIAALSSLVFGASMALGAFLAGMVVGQSKVSEQAAADALPMKDAFAVLFFVSVGMLFNPMIIVQQPVLVLCVLGIILIAKPLVALLIVLGLGYSSSTALTVAIGLAQIGEFSFILSGEAKKLGILPAESESVLVAAAIISISLNPLLFRAVTKLEGAIRKREKLWRALNWRAEMRGKKLREIAEKRLASEELSEKPRAIVVGYGPVGRTLTRVLSELGVEPVVVDLNVDTVATITQMGNIAIYGDASKAEILTAAGVEKAKYLVVTPPDLGSRLPVVTTAKRLNQNLQVFSRARYLTERDMLEKMGVTQVTYEEAESAVGLAALLLKLEGADEHRIATESEKIRTEFGEKGKDTV